MENSSISSRLTAGECELVNLLLIDSRDLELIDRLSMDSSGSCVRSRDDKKSQLFIILVIPSRSGDEFKIQPALGDGMHRLQVVDFYLYPTNLIGPH